MWHPNRLGFSGLGFLLFLLFFVEGFGFEFMNLVFRNLFVRKVEKWRIVK
jgi:hypothetical protein